MRIAVVAALVIAAIAGLTVAVIGGGTGPLTDEDVHGALDESGYPARYLETDYDGPGAVVAVEVRQGHRHAQVVVASDADLQEAKESVDWNPRPGSSVAMGDGPGENDLYVWTSDDLTPGAFWDIVDALCKARLDDDERCEGI